MSLIEAQIQDERPGALRPFVCRNLKRWGCKGIVQATIEKNPDHAENIQIALIVSLWGLVTQQLVLRFGGLVQVEMTAEAPSRCADCGCSLATYRTVQATVLDVSGWRAIRHRLMICWRLTCSRYRVVVGYNFITGSAYGRRHMFEHHGEAMKYFFISLRVAVTVEWLRQFSRRILFHYASFEGEAKVHRLEALVQRNLEDVPKNSKRLILRAWFLWRLVIRWEEHLATGVAVDVEAGINLREKVTALLAVAWGWYPAHMLTRRVALAREKEVTLEALVVDGNWKMSGRICGRPCAEVMGSSSGVFAVSCCSGEPAWKKRRCGLHDMAQAPADPYPPQIEKIVSHRACVRLAGQQGRLPYQVFLKCRDPQHADLAGRWEAADHVTPTQLHEYWGQLEKVGFVQKQSSQGDLQACGCQTHKEAMKVQAQLVKSGRCNGWLFAVTPCGFIVHAKPFYGTESIPQKYIFVNEILDQVPELSIILHDDSCHMRLYAEKQKHLSDIALRLSHPRMRWIVDRLHIKGQSRSLLLDRVCVVIPSLSTAAFPKSYVGYEVFSANSLSQSLDNCVI